MPANDRTLRAVALFVSVSIVWGCSGDDGSAPPPPLPALAVDLVAELVSQPWGVAALANTIVDFEGRGDGAEIELHIVECTPEPPDQGLCLPQADRAIVEWGARSRPDWLDDGYVYQGGSATVSELQDESYTMTGTASSRTSDTDLLRLRLRIEAMMDLTVPVVFPRHASGSVDLRCSGSVDGTELEEEGVVTFLGDEDATAILEMRGETHRIDLDDGTHIPVH